MNGTGRGGLPRGFKLALELHIASSSDWMEFNERFGFHPKYGAWPSVPCWSGQLGMEASEGTGDARVSPRERTQMRERRERGWGWGENLSRENLLLPEKSGPVVL